MEFSDIFARRKTATNVGTSVEATSDLYLVLRSASERLIEHTHAVGFLGPLAPVHGWRRELCPGTYEPGVPFLKTWFWAMRYKSTAELLSMCQSREVDAVHPLGCIKIEPVAGVLIRFGDGRHSQIGRTVEGKR